MQEFYLNAAALEDDIEALLKNISFKLPSDFISFLKKSNGGEGFINDEYIIIWRAEELIIFNQEYQVEKYVENVFFIGSNGGGEAIAYDLTDMSINFIPFIGMNRKYLSFKSKNFGEFINGK